MARSRREYRHPLLVDWPFPLKKISVAIPKTYGGGAETFTKNFAIWLNKKGKLSRLYTAQGDSYFSENSVCLGEMSARKAIRRFCSESSKDTAASYLLTLGYINFAFCLALRRRANNIVLRICNPPLEEMKLLKGVELIRYWFGTWLSCFVADEVIVQSDYMRRSIIKARLASAKKLSVIKNPVNSELWAWRNTEKIFKNPYILSASTNKPQKDLNTLITAFGMVQNQTDRHLVLAGVDPTDQEILGWILASGVDVGRVHCLGFVDPLYPLIEHADLCVLTSIFEGFSNFLLEAATYGKRIVATNSPGGNSEFFLHYPNHKTVPVRDIHLLSAALLEKKHDIGAEETKIYLREYDSENIYERYMNILNKKRCK